MPFNFRILISAVLFAITPFGAAVLAQEKAAPPAKKALSLRTPGRQESMTLNPPVSHLVTSTKRSIGAGRTPACMAERWGPLAMATHENRQSHSCCMTP